MRKALIYIVLLFCCVAMRAQVPMEGVFLQPLQERDSVLIADQLLYGFELKQVEEGTRFALPQWQNDEGGGVQAISPWMVDTVKVTKQKNGMPRLLDIKAGITITSFDEGIYELPQIMVGRLSADGVLDSLVFEPMRLEVKTMPVDTATFVPHDIKGQIRYPVTLAEVLPWVFWGFVAAMLIILVICLIIIHRRRNNPEYARSEPAHIVALRKLDKYRGNKMWVPEKQKAFYSGVTDALREYIVARYGIGAMEMTTAEIFEDMKDAAVPEELLKEVRELFERADFVKFAKFVASDEDNAAALPVAVRFVTETYQDEIQTEQEEAEKAAEAEAVSGPEEKKEDKDDHSRYAPGL